MLKLTVRRLGLPICVAMGIAQPSSVEAYPIDCAILLCLAGGFPASAECSAAKAEFIRRITPFPIEPPLQIWRCPLGASHKQQQSKPPLQYLRDAADGGPLQAKQSFPIPTPAVVSGSVSHSGTGSLPETPLPVRQEGQGGNAGNAPMVFLAQQIVNGVADIDISGSEFDFVRSIRVFDVSKFSFNQREDGTPRWQYSGRVGEYDHSGGFSWRGLGGAQGFPHAEFGEGGGRAVVIRWRDHAGNSDHETVRY